MSKTWAERHEKSIREVTVFLIAVAALYANVIASFLAVFVPQRCDREVSLGTRNSTVARVQTDCTFAENVYIDITPFNAFTLAINLFTCLVLGFGFYLEWRRDLFIIESFDVDENKGDNMLRIQLEEPGRSALRENLRGYNRMYRNYFIGLLIIFLSNVVVSGVLVFHYFYQDYRTATTFITSISLVSQRLYSSLYVAFDCVTNEKAESNNLNVPLAFNIVKDESTPRSPSHHFSANGKHRERVLGSVMENSKTKTFGVFAPRSSMRAFWTPTRGRAGLTAPPSYPYPQPPYPVEPFPPQKHHGTGV